MTRRKSIAGLIGNGLYVQLFRGESLLEAYKRTSPFFSAKRHLRSIANTWG